MESYVYNGYKRAEVLEIDLTDGTGTSITNYPKEYNIRSCKVINSEGEETDIDVPIGGTGTNYYDPLSAALFVKLSTAEYEDRVEDFITYIETEESDYDHSVDCTNTSRVEDPTTCPVGTGV